MPAQETSPASTPSATTKSQKPAPTTKGGGTPPKSPGESNTKARPVRALHFSQLVRWPGIGGSFTTLTTTRPEIPQLNSQNVCYADTIFEYNGEFCINGRFWMTKNTGALLTWEY